MRKLNHDLIISTVAEYLKLKHLPFNRDFNYRDDLAKSMNKYYCWGRILAIKTSLFDSKPCIYIIDGQNRAATASRLGIPFIVEILDIEIKTVAELVLLVASINTTQKKWQPDQYVRAFALSGEVVYQQLRDITKSCPFTITTVATMLYGFRSRGKIAEVIATGEFKINQLELTQYTLELAAKLSKIGDMSSRMALAMHYVASLKTFNEAKFMAAYIKNYECVKELKLDDYSDVFASWLD